MNRRRFLITGGNGQLGQEFSRYFAAAGIDFRSVDLGECDIADADSLERVMSGFSPAVVINCAAYNQVDLAEQHPLALYQGNVIGVANLIAACRTRGCLLIHYSSDYVFAGAGKTPLTETDPTAPGNVYGRTKLLGEQLLAQGDVEHLLFRVSWLYGTGTQNFIYKLRQWAAGQKVLKIADDEFSVPVWTGLVVELTLAALERNLRGLYHLVPGGYCSRLDWAREIARLCRLSTPLEPVGRDFFGLPAHRPGFSAMSHQKLRDVMQKRIGPWQEYLETFIRQETKKGC